MVKTRSSLAALLFVAGCAGAPAPSSDAAADASVATDIAHAEAAVEAGAPPDDCVIERVMLASQCNESCGARLTLPSGQRFCTQPCTSDEYCQRDSPTLKCAIEAGACAERCASDAECAARGFARCHPVGMFCDTIPACTSNAQCTAIGLARCVLPGAYCE